MSPTDCTPDDFKCQSSIAWDCYTAPDLSIEERACDGDWKPIYTCENCDWVGGPCNVFTCYPPTCEDLPADEPYHPSYNQPECSDGPNDGKCRSSNGWDCYTAPDESIEERKCEGDWQPIYTGTNCDRFGFGNCNEFTCYPPTCHNEDLPADEPYHPTNRGAETTLIVIIVSATPSRLTHLLVSPGPHPPTLTPQVLIVVGIVGGTVGGVLCCWCAKCCCFEKKNPRPPHAGVAQQQSVELPSTAAPVAVATATAVPVVPTAVPTANAVPTATAVPMATQSA